MVSRTPSTPSRARTRTAVRSGSTWDANRQSRRGDADHRRRAGPAPRASRPRPRSSRGPRRTSRAECCSALESTGARMSRLGSETLAGAPLLELDEVVARIEAVSRFADLEELADELWDPATSRSPGSVPTSSASTTRSRAPRRFRPHDPRRRQRRGWAHGLDHLCSSRGRRRHGRSSRGSTPRSE